MAVALIAPTPLSAQGPATTIALAITGIKAKLYFPETGDFSQDMLADPNLDLWNTIIGAGWAQRPSNATLVLVEISGKGDAGSRPVSVELTVTDARNGGVKLRRRSSLGFSEGNKPQEAFWIYDTGCEPLILRARLIGQAAPSTVKKKIPFRCGE
ncbi:MAG: hypothetical protein LH467_02350 [Gemmatimonadaceae bacterium]|nr:hypothetical protein [Gemmatimonadaceae bacterium]